MMALSLNVLAVDPINAPTIEYARLSPLLIVFGAALAGVVVEAFVPRALRRVSQMVVAMVGLVAAFAALMVWSRPGSGTINAVGSVALDGPAIFCMGTVLVLGLLAVLMFGENAIDPSGDAFAPRASFLPGSPDERLATDQGVLQTEVYPLLMFSIGGMLLFPAANDLLTMFVALEVLSLPLYLLAGLARRRRLLSQEAALKYFLLGAYSSAFLLFGSALIYGFSGSLRFSEIATSVSSTVGMDAMLLTGVGLIAVGLLFKVGAAPFHQWTPDVYQGAPTPVTAFMAAATKVAAFGALLRLFYVAFAGVQWDWRPMMWAVAIITMLLGAILAVTQTDVKRMLAYSSVAHAGFLLTGVVALSPAGTAGVLFYLLVYGFTTIGAFAVVSLVRDDAGEATHLSQWAGLAKRAPVLSALFSLFLLALAGIPLTSGFAGKFAVFSAAVAGGATPVVIVGVIASAIAAFFYVRIIVLMYFSEPRADGPTVAMPSGLTSAALAVGAAATIFLGVYPAPLLQLADNASVFVR